MAETSCAELVRAGDKDVFLATLFAPEVSQPHLHALHAFALEVATIPLRVSESQIGEIRLQWWTDTLATFATGAAQSHPVAQALAQTAATCALPMAPLSALVDAHRFDLYADKPENFTALEAHLGATRSVLFQLSCLILSPTLSPGAATASGLAGVALALSRILLSPVATEKHTPPGLSRQDLLTLAEKRLNEARAAIALLPPALLPAFLPLAIAELNLKAARAERTSVSHWRKQWRLWNTARSEKI